MEELSVAECRLSLYKDRCAALEEAYESEKCEANTEMSGYGDTDTLISKLK